MNGIERVVFHAGCGHKKSFLYNSMMDKNALFLWYTQSCELTTSHEIVVHQTKGGNFRMPGSAVPENPVYSLANCNLPMRPIPNFDNRTFYRH